MRGVLYGIPIGLLSAAVILSQLHLPDGLMLPIAAGIACITTVIFVRIRTQTSPVQNPEPIADVRVEGDGLTRGQLVLVVLICMLFPVVGGAVLFKVLRPTHPKKAIEANNVAWIVFAIYLFAIVGLVYWGRGWF